MNELMTFLLNYVLFTFLLSFFIFFLTSIYLTFSFYMSLLKVLEVSSIKLTSIALSMARECEKDKGDDEEEEEEVGEGMIDEILYQNHH